MQSFSLEAQKSMSCIPILGAVIDWLYFTLTRGWTGYLFGGALGWLLYHYHQYPFNIALHIYHTGFIWGLVPIAIICSIGFMAKYLSSTLKFILTSTDIPPGYGSKWYTASFFALLIGATYFSYIIAIDSYGKYDYAHFYTVNTLLTFGPAFLALFIITFYGVVRPVVTSIIFISLARQKRESASVQALKQINTSKGPIVIDWSELRKNKLISFSGARHKVVSGKIVFDEHNYCTDEMAEQTVWNFLQLHPNTLSGISFTPPESDRLGLPESYIIHLTKAALAFGFRPDLINLYGNKNISTKKARLLAEEIKTQFIEDFADAKQYEDELSRRAELEKLKYEEEVKLRSDELESMIGLQSVKEEIKRLNAMLTYNQSRLAEGLDEISQGSYHMVFTGNPGTGKTVVARLVAKMLTDKGILKNDKVIEVTRSDLVGKYVGHTAPQVRSIVDEAMGGVLFIDEAYTLSSGGEKDFGQEAINELLKLMEDRRGEFVVITAGYKQQMDNFLQSNEGLKRRFSRFIHFDDYSNQELLDIYMSMANKSGDILDDLLVSELPDLISHWRENYGTGFGNAGSIRQLLEAMQKSRPLRLIEDNIEMKGKALVTLTKKDWDNAIEMTSFN